MSEMIDIIANYGLTVVICGLFFWQYFKQQDYNREREEKLYSVIDTMSKTLPEIKNKVDSISDEVREMKNNGR